MKKIKLFFLAFLGVCLGLTSFSSADICLDQLLNTGTVNFDSSSSSANRLFSIATDGVGGGGNGTYCFRALSIDNHSNASLQLGFANSSTATPNNLYKLWGDQYGKWVCLYGNKPYFNFLITTSDFNGGSYNLNFEWFAFQNDRASSRNNYLNCVSVLSNDYSSLSSSYDILSGNLSSCQSDLSDCRGGQDASLLACIDQKEQCESSLTTLSGNYASLENMNLSLSSQLQECLENSSGSGDLICNKFDLFWSSDNTNYSFPIKNDLILPPGYKGFVNEGVLAIKKDSSLESSYSIDDEDFQGIVSDFGKVFVFIFSGGLFVLFLFIIRKYFTSLFK